MEYKNNSYGSWGNQGGNKLGMEGVKAPYNFVPFSNKVYEYPDGELTAHCDMREELATGEITYEITAKTPVFVDDGTGEFYTNSKGEYAIPGSTMRGLIRNNVQILGLASFFDDIDDYALMYRNVAAGLEKDAYAKILGAASVPLDNGAGNKQISVLKNVKAGYIRKKNGEYYIYRTVVDTINKTFGEMNYYPLSERKMIEQYLNLEDKSKFDYGFFAPDKHILQNEFKPFRKEKNKWGKMQYIGTENKDYKPYCNPISYELKNLRNVTAVGNIGEYAHDGYVVSTGKMRQKKVLYIIPQIDETKECIKVLPEDVRTFQIDYKKRENKLKGNEGGFFKLPEEGETKPVFYIQLNRLYFGFTPRLRIFYDHTIKEGLNRNHKAGIVDYSKAMFGYSDDEKMGSYKSKLSFTDAVITDMGKDTLEGERKAILGEPNPTSCLEYVKQKPRKEKENLPDTYNRDDFELRGIKQYWLHKEAVWPDVKKEQDKVASNLHPIKKEACFRGKVRFQNLTRNELGLLLWSIKLDEGSRMNVGKAKPLGYGQIQVDILEAKEVDLKKAYGGNTLELEPFKPIDIEKAVEDYKTEISRFTSPVKIDDMSQIKAFFAMKDSTRIPDNRKTAYMELEGYKNQLRDKTALPTINQVLGKEH